MKTLMLLAAICLVLCVVLPQTDALCLRYRVVTCGVRYLSNCGWYRVCLRYYRTTCYYKRDQIENDKGKVKSTKKGPEKAILEKFPYKFSTYDKDGDKSITFDEFRTTISDVKKKTDLKKVFNSADENKDGVINCDEFKLAPWGFSKKPVCD
ncbi:uncharacterized protein LOC116294288 [Actinia tenebrosa]|uniref:Uncharacterized protein LOC116294288 n=1 Tax=Actinia tenebrosa TaxID=6105 RepID=A0A6P8HYH3_ACTTE|nr:uncharacterized protein LOC116294288 [Actinia tenebrosa]